MVDTSTTSEDLKTFREPEGGGGEGYGERGEEWPEGDGWPEGEEEGAGNLKAATGACHTCGGWGPFSRECPSKGKGKTGGGKQGGYKGKSKGKGKAYGKGGAKGKGNAKPLEEPTTRCKEHVGKGIQQQNESAKTKGKGKGILQQNEAATKTEEAKCWGSGSTNPHVTTKSRGMQACEN